MMLGGAQIITMAEDAQQVWNYIMAGAQIGLGIVAIWTKDDDGDDEIDILQEKPKVKVTAPHNVDVEVKKESGGMSFTEGHGT